MQDLIDDLYAYAHQNRVTKYLQTPEYRQVTHGLEENWEHFRSTLSEVQRQKLDALLVQESEIEKLEDEASFLAGISIGLDLGRL